MYMYMYMIYVYVCVYVYMCMCAYVYVYVYVDFLSAPSNFLAQWSRIVDSKILGPTILSMKNGRKSDALWVALKAMH